MIDRLFQEAFPPVWVKETEDTDIVFPWSAGPVLADPKVLLVAEGESGLVTTEPSPSGSFIATTPAGLVWRLTAADAAGLKDRTVLFGVWIDRAPMDGEPDTTGVVIVSDWAFAPAEGRA